MSKKVVVISLGGSLIIGESETLGRFRKVLRNNYSKYKFVIVCGGGAIARKYISVLERQGKPKKELSMAGILATRTNAEFVMKLFGENEANDILPRSMKEIKDNLKKNNVVVCGALRYTKNSTSDSTSAQIANFLGTDFINITNIKGLYDKNPLKNKNAKFISEISWKEFHKLAAAKKFKAGQHFVLDQNASEIIMKNKITTYIIGSEFGNITKILKREKFTGTIIQG